MTGSGETGDLRVYGAIASPYSLKIRALLRYRRIPHLWIASNDSAEMERLYRHVKAPVIPVVRFPDGTVMNDSTPLAYELERRYPGHRAAIPADPVQAFLCLLLEDMADEWLTKAIFHYRWNHAPDQEAMSRWIMFDRHRGEGLQAIRDAADAFRRRQTGRTALVGCTAENAPAIEASTGRALALLDGMVPGQLFLFGARPCLADFAWYGQLSQLAVDPTPAALLRRDAPFVMRWLEHVDDTSGVEGDWQAPEAPLHDGVMGLLRLAGEVYLPFLDANAKAFAAREERFELDLLGHRYAQGTFKYQAHCLAALRQALAEVPAEARSRLDPLLDEAGALPFLAA